AGARRILVRGRCVGTAGAKRAGKVAAGVIRDGPVRNPLDFSFPPTQFTKLLQEAALSRGWIALITDRDGGVVARVPDAAAFVGKKEGQEWTTKTASTDEGVLKGDVLRGPSVYAAYRRSRETGWVVAVAAPIKLVDAGIRRSMLALSGGGVLLLAVACGLAYVLGKRIAAPIVALSDWLKAEPEAPLPPAQTRVSEVEDLRRA